MVAETEAVLLMVPPAPGAVTVIVIAGAAPTARLARVHVTVPVSSPQAQPEPVADTCVIPAGRVSVTVSDWAVLGPAFDTARL